MTDSRTVTISLPPDLAAEVDAAAAAEGRSRSEVFREAARRYLRQRERWEQIFSYGERAAERAGVRTEDEVAEAVSDRRRAKRASR